MARAYSMDLRLRVLQDATAGSRVEGLVAPGVFEEPIDTASFTAWVEPVLVPALQPGTSSSSTISRVARVSPRDGRPGPRVRSSGFCRSTARTSIPSNCVLRR